MDVIGSLRRRMRMAALAVLTVSAAGCGWGGRARPGDSLVVYCGRSEELIGPLIERYRQETGVDLRVRYGRTAEMAATLLEEGDRSPADLFLAQDAGALGALAARQRLYRLPDDVLSRVEPRFRDPGGQWVGLSGRARVVVHHPGRAPAETLPRTLEGFTGREWHGRIGWAPTNGSFQAFVTALRMERGEAWTRAWLEAIRDLRPRVYARNTPLVLAVASGEVDVGFSNHYYVFQLLRERGGEVPARNHMLDDGTLVNVAGIGLLRTARDSAAALDFIRFLLDEEAQGFFTRETFEYPLAVDAERHPDLPPLRDLATPDLDLSELHDVEGTLRLLTELGIL